MSAPNPQTIPRLLQSLRERAAGPQGYNYTTLVKIDMPAMIEALETAYKTIDTVNTAAWAEDSNDTPFMKMRAIARTTDGALKCMADSLARTKIG